MCVWERDNLNLAKRHGAGPIWIRPHEGTELLCPIQFSLSWGIWSTRRGTEDQLGRVGNWKERSARPLIISLVGSGVDTKRGPGYVWKFSWHCHYCLDEQNTLSWGMKGDENSQGKWPSTAGLGFVWLAQEQSSHFLVTKGTGFIKGLWLKSIYIQFYIPPVFNLRHVAVAMERVRAFLPSVEHQRNLKALFILAHWEKMKGIIHSVNGWTADKSIIWHYMLILNWLQNRRWPMVHLATKEKSRAHLTKMLLY